LRCIKHSLLFSILPAILIGVSLIAAAIFPAWASTGTPDASILERASNQLVWSQPINLSHTGAANKPRILALPSGMLQAFWIDRFDGLVTSVFNGDTWSLPVIVPFPGTFIRQQPTTVSVMPELVIDGQNRIHAFWYGPPDPVTGQSPLNENQMQFGTTDWSLVSTLAESALVFAVARTETGLLHLAYIRNLKTDQLEPGVYVRSTISNGIWRSAVAVQTSIYFRVLPVTSAFIRAASSKGILSLAWSEPRLGEVSYSDSADGGSTWTEPQNIEFLDAKPSNPLLFPRTEGGIIRIWQDISQTGCSLYQQRLDFATLPPIEQPASTLPPGSFYPTPTSAQNALIGDWGQPERILNNIQTCPTSSIYDLKKDTLYWIWGTGTPLINFVAWDAQTSEWTLPQTISYSFQDAETGRPIQLDELDVHFSGDQIVLIGTDLVGGDVWTVMASTSAMDLAHEPPSPWMAPIMVSQIGVQVNDPTVALDDGNHAHLVWSQGRSALGSSLLYSQYDGQQASAPAEIIKGGGGKISRQPDLIVGPDSRLHLVWSGGATGQLFYTRARTDQAGSASGWLPAKTLDTMANTSHPQIAFAPSGRLYVVYAIPVNEKRGIYLVYSDDGGENWSAPQLVFDAEGAAWEAVDHPTMVIAPDGSLHMAFAQLTTAGALPTTGVFYTRSVGPIDENSTPKDTWIDPFEVAQDGADWPRLVLVSGQLHIIIGSGTEMVDRWMLLDKQLPDGSGWGSTDRIPGWQDLSFSGDPPCAVAADAYNIYLISASPGAQGLLFSEWNVQKEDPTSGRWSQPENFVPDGRWKNSLSLASAATVSSGGSLVVSWLAFPPLSGQTTLQPSVPGLYFSIRSLDAVQPPPAPTIGPTVISTEQVSPTPQLTSSPVPTISVNTAPAAVPSPISPQVVGGGLAAVIVIIIFVTILMRGRPHGG
jgi:hypothetical protein